MNDKSKHHWSFDYNYGAQNPQFTQELIGTLNGCYADIDALDTQAGQAITHIYNILPYSLLSAITPVLKSLKGYTAPACARSLKSRLTTRLAKCAKINYWLKKRDSIGRK